MKIESPSLRKLLYDYNVAEHQLSHFKFIKVDGLVYAICLDMGHIGHVSCYIGGQWCSLESIPKKYKHYDMVQKLMPMMRIWATTLMDLPLEECLRQLDQ